MASHAHSHSHDGAHGHHLHGGPRVYLAVLLALLFLTIVTVVASKIDFGSAAANVIIALGIATVKGTLVALWFMHLKYDKPVNGMIFVATLFFLFLFFLFPYIDTTSRFDIKPSNWKGPAYMPDTGAAVKGIGANFPVAPKEKPAAAPAPQH
jgi:cytochrome c oxidase subunit IV